MSTFKGVVEEFPEILIDYFRIVPPRQPPLAVFLSHVHSDHLQGLESFNGPFIYCSPATRELLLRLEKYPHRLNFAKGILETRKQHYKKLKTRLKTIPINTPTDIELKPGRTLQVTLLDANHCAGAVMFLIEDTVNAILYTGDIRAETWWINTLIRNPTILEYSQGRRRLDKMYLDTTFATKKEPYASFPSKQQGMQELLEKVAKYPAGTIFHFNSWTFGYEEVWISLAKALGSPIHVDNYKYSIYSSLAAIPGEGPQSLEGSALCGFKCGNRYQPGCLTDNPMVRLHSCERGVGCPTLEASKVVWITPIVTRTSQGPVPELGAGGGGGDLVQAHELMLDDFKAVDELLKLCSEQIHEPKTRAKVVELVRMATETGNKMMSLGCLGLESIHAEIPLKKLAYLLSTGTAREQRSCSRRPKEPNGQTKSMTISKAAEELPENIQFPYSRHSSYNELCNLVDAFKPVDVYPCVVDEEKWILDVSIKSLFGNLCSGQSFAHDQTMLGLQAQRAALQREVDEQILLENSFSTTQLSIGSVGPEDGDPPLVIASTTEFTKHSPSLYDSGRSTKRRRISNVLHTQASGASSEPLHIVKANGERIPQAEATRSLEISFDRWLEEDSVDNAAISNMASGVTIPSLDGAADERPSYNPAQTKHHRLSNLSFTSGEPDYRRFDEVSKEGIREPPAIRLNGAGNSYENQTSQADISISDSAFYSQESVEPQTNDPAQIRRRKNAYLAAKGEDGRAWRTFSPISAGNAHEAEIELN